jgi:hypothetical protein
VRWEYVTVSVPLDQFATLEDHLNELGGTVGQHRPSNNEELVHMNQLPPTRANVAELLSVSEGNGWEMVGFCVTDRQPAEPAAFRAVLKRAVV